MSTAAKKLSIRLEAVGGDKVRREFKSLGGDGERAFQRITQVITPANDNLKAMNQTAQSFNNILKQTAGLVGAYASFRGFTSAFKGIYSINQEFESLSGSLKTVTGSAEGAREAFAVIEKFALDTPYQLEEIVEAFIRLKALGLEPSMEALTSYGNTASAFGKNIMDFTEALSNAVMFNFRSLRSFGIMATTEGDKVKFTFQGITTEVAKNSKAIEQYLRNIGDVNFGGAMMEQMSTMGGVMSNIEDALGSAARTIGATGLNQVITESLKKLNDLIDNSDKAAKSIGKTLTTAVSLASKAFFGLAENIEPVITLLTTRLGAAAIVKTFTMLRGSVLMLNSALLGTSAASLSATAGIRMMWQVSKLAAVQMYATTAAANLLKGALALIGGPAGLAILAGMAIYKLVDSHNVAKRAAEDHADTLQKLKDELKATTEEAARFSAEQTKDMALAEWGLKLKTAEQNVRDLREELKKTGGLSLTTRFTPNAFLKDYEIYAKETADILRQSKIDLEQYQKQIWEIASEYPDFQPQAQEIQDKLLLLKAAEKDAWAAREELKYLQNPDLRPKNEVKTEVKPTVSIDVEAYKKNIEDIKQKILELKTPYEQAMIKADEWRKNALKNLDASSADYEKYKEQINQVYDNMVKKADDAALQSSKSLADGFKRGFVNLQNELEDFAALSESAVKNAFNDMENVLADFVATGKANIADLVQSIISDFAKIAIRQSITQPLMSGLSSYFGFATAHTGGVIGADSLSSKTVSADVFANAPRYHTGGLVGNEIPIIAQRGETVFTKGQMAALGAELNNKTPVLVNVNVHNNTSGTTAKATSKQEANGNLSIDVIVEKIEGAIGKNISKGEGLSPILEQRYALNPAYGSYR
ncbi:MAG: hypothetical protein NC218_04385 [Acetobacter sp.]|nr:hypothetical protein [Acetobacter sp.]